MLTTKLLRISAWSFIYTDTMTFQRTRSSEPYIDYGDLTNSRIMRVTIDIIYKNTILNTFRSIHECIFLSCSSYCLREASRDAEASPKPTVTQIRSRAT